MIFRFPKCLRGVPTEDREVTRQKPKERKDHCASHLLIKCKIKLPEWNTLNFFVYDALFSRQLQKTASSSTLHASKIQLPSFCFRGGKALRSVLNIEALLDHLSSMHWVYIRKRTLDRCPLLLSCVTWRHSCDFQYLPCLRAVIIIIMKHLRLCSYLVRLYNQVATVVGLGTVSSASDTMRIFLEFQLEPLLFILCQG